MAGGADAVAGGTAAITTARAEETAQVVALMSLAFSADPVVRWFYPDPERYWTYFPPLVRAFCGAAVEQGTTSVLPGYAGATMWFAPGAHGDDEAVGALIEQSVEAHLHDEVFAVFERMGAAHPATPHWYLPLIGVDPSLQGRGLGSALLRHDLERCDREGLLAYLDSTNPKNLSLYRRHGFEVIDEIQAGPARVWPMLRRPR